MPSKPSVIKEKRLTDPEFAERQREYARAYRKRNLERDREQNKNRANKKRSNDRESYNEYMRLWRERNKDSINKKSRERLLTDVEYADRVRMLDRERYKKDPLKHRSVSLKSAYGITLEDYDLMYDKQHGKCAICNTERKRGGHDGLVIDHCHTKGHVRELLCASCNHGLGKFKDDIERMKNAVAYLTKHK